MDLYDWLGILAVVGLLTFAWWKLFGGRRGR